VKIQIKIRRGSPASCVSAAQFADTSADDLLSQLSSAYYAQSSEVEGPTPDSCHGVATARCRRPGRAAQRLTSEGTAWKTMLLRRSSMQTGNAARRPLAGSKSDFAGCVVQSMPKWKLPLVLETRNLSHIETGSYRTKSVGSALPLTGGCS
jgi:hypothetical protein